MFLATALLSCVLAAFMALSGLPKLAGGPRTAGMAQHLRVPTGSLRIIGALEVAAAAGLLVGSAWTWLGVAAAGGLVVLMLGGVVSHLRVEDPFAKALPALIAAIVAAATLALHLAAP
ncbi:DoxX family protein [Streptomyces sp. NPDC002133]|uniref:DoxX family protein n=1 Tax=Streptomyces sp. NPDC002133 TaxID=3154409 RepID=UPI00333366D0